MALVTNGLVVAWGYDGEQLGWHLTEVPVDLTNAIAIAAGPLHSVALRTDGSVECWGDNDIGQTSVRAGLSNVVAIAGGGKQSLALQADGTVVGWGLVNVPGRMTGVKTIASGWSHNLAIRSSPLPPVILEEPMDQYALAGETVTLFIARPRCCGSAISMAV